MAQDFNACDIWQFFTSQLGTQCVASLSPVRRSRLDQVPAAITSVPDAMFGSTAWTLRWMPRWNRFPLSRSNPSVFRRAARSGVDLHFA